MTTDITIFSNVPAHLRGAELSDTTKALMGNGSTLKRISIKGGVFRLVQGGKEISQIEDRHIDVIIAKAAPAISRQYYAEGYDPEANPAPPECWSNDGVTPDASAKNKQCDTCAKCPQNIAGSGKGDTRACRFMQRLAVMLPDDMDSGVYALTLPSTSIFGKAEGGRRPLQDYARYLAAQTKPVNIDMLVTRMKFDTSVESPKVHFAPVRWLDDAEYALMKDAKESEDATRAITMTAFAADGAGKPAAEPLALEGTRPDVEEEPKVEKAKPGRKPKVKEEPAAEVETDEPEKRKPAAKADAAVPQKSSLAGIVSEWDDE